jgi:hypothetical protein
MPRVFVTTDGPGLPGNKEILLNEQVASVHLSSGHAASQLIERLAWAISDAEEAEHGRPNSSRVVAAFGPAPGLAPSRQGRRRGAAPSRRRAPTPA